MSIPGRSLLDFETVTPGLLPDEPPTWAFFATQWHDAAAGDGNQSTDEVIAAVDEVEQIILGLHQLRAKRRLDVIDFAMVLNLSYVKAYGDEYVAQTAEAIADSIIQAYFHWDKERYGEDHAWGMQQSRGQVEARVAARLARLAALEDT